MVHADHGLLDIISQFQPTAELVRASQQVLEGLLLPTLHSCVHLSIVHINAAALMNHVALDDIRRRILEIERWININTSQQYRDISAVRACQWFLSVIEIVLLHRRMSTLGVMNNTISLAHSVLDKQRRSTPTNLGRLSAH